MIENKIDIVGDHDLKDVERIRTWIIWVIKRQGQDIGDLTYQFMNDEELNEINIKFLGHDDYTDIITFDYTEGSQLSADICISKERVLDNAIERGLPYEEEMRRVMIHGVLHCLGHKDKTREEKELMRKKENECLELFHVEHKI